MRYQDTGVVGVEGPEPDRFVLDWAAQEAAARGVQLWVCHCWEWSSIDRAPLPVPADVAAEPRSAPEGVVDAAVDTVHATFPDLLVTGTLGYGRATTALLDISDQAELIVVGARGLGGFTGLVLGSVSQQVIRHAPCPVIVAH